MSIKEHLEYLNFYIKNLSVNLIADIEKFSNDQVKVDISLGFAEPRIIEEENNLVAVFPYRLEFRSSDQVSIDSEFFIGFAIKSDSIRNLEDLKSLVNENKDEFVKYITRTINQLIDNALEHTNIRFEEQFAIEPLNYL